MAYKLIYFLGCGILLSALTLFPIPAAADGTVVTITTETVVAPGADFAATISIAGVADFIGAQDDVVYDPAVIQVIDVTSGNISGIDVPVYRWDFVPAGFQGTIRIINLIQGNPPNAGASGSGSLAVIYFHVVGSAGTSSVISLENGVLGDKYANQITAAWTGSMIEVSADLPSQPTAESVSPLEPPTETNQPNASAVEAPPSPIELPPPREPAYETVQPDTSTVAASASHGERPVEGSDIWLLYTVGITVAGVFVIALLILFFFSRTRG